VSKRRDGPLLWLSCIMAIDDVLVLLNELLLEDAARRQLREGTSPLRLDDDSMFESSSSHLVSASGYEVSATIGDVLTLMPQWRTLTTRLSLTRFERCVLLLGLAPEVDLRYGAAYGFLNDDPSQRCPTRELALRLFTPKNEDPAAYRHYLADGAPLTRLGLIRPVDGIQTSWVAQPFAIHPEAAHFLLGAEEITPYVEHPFHYSRLRVGWDDVPVSRALRNRLLKLVDIIGQPSPQQEPPIVSFEGLPGSGEKEALSALATALGTGVLFLDLGLVTGSEEHIDDLLRTAVVHQILHESIIALEGFQTSGAVSPGRARLARGIQQLAGEAFGPVVVCSEGGFRPLDAERRTIAIRFDIPVSSDRVHYWNDAARDAGLVLSDSIIRELADRFPLSPSQIRAALQAALDLLRLDGYDECTSDERLREALFTSAGDRTPMDNISVTKVPVSAQSWNALLLPESTLSQLRDFTQAARTDTIARAALSADVRRADLDRVTLLCGIPPREKTMIASMIADETHASLYRIDLSSLVGKYIGETEKNIDILFASLEDAGAVLFFDEADALFGKRTDVSDAHDRYANQEISYLLERIEAHEGLVILASNQKSNIDPAFLRRLHYIVELPRPDEVFRVERRITPPS
jgi:hypothetical protein